MSIWKYACLLLMISSCAIQSPLNENNLQKSLGKKVTVKGKAINAHLGAFILDESGKLPAIWIADFDNWPDGYYKGELDAKKVKVTGILIERYDRPVFIQNDTLPRHGIPMPEGTDLKKASHRYLLKEVKYK